MMALVKGMSKIINIINGIALNKLTKKEVVPYSGLDTVVWLLFDKNKIIPKIKPMMKDTNVAITVI